MLRGELAQIVVAWKTNLEGEKEQVRVQKRKGNKAAALEIQVGKSTWVVLCPAAVLFLNARDHLVIHATSCV